VNRSAENGSVELIAAGTVATFIGLVVAFSLSAVRLGAEADVRRIRRTQGRGLRS
jgi:hypothetical protein